MISSDAKTINIPSLKDEFNKQEWKELNFLRFNWKTYVYFFLSTAIVLEFQP